jgi:hypothetical protein
MWRNLHVRMVMYWYKWRGGMGSKHLQVIPGIACPVVQRLIVNNLV